MASLLLGRAHCSEKSYYLAMSLPSQLNLFPYIMMPDGYSLVYGPCTADRKRTFIEWFKDIQMPGDVDWIIMGDFNLIRSPDNRNKPGGNLSEMFMFNDAISRLDLNEIVL